MGDLISISPSLIDAEAHAQKQDEIIQLYRTFFFGEKLSKLEYEIESEYLMEKLKKYSNLKSERKLESDVCAFSTKNFKRLSFLENCHSRNLDYYDDFSPVMIVY